MTDALSLTFSRAKRFKTLTTRSVGGDGPVTCTPSVDRLTLFSLRRTLIPIYRIFIPNIRKP